MPHIPDMSQDHKDIIIKPADKGGSICILDKVYYNSEITNHLEQSGSYMSLQCNPLTTIKSEIDDLLKHGFENNWISKGEFEFLTVEFPITPVIYGLPKVHKNPTKPPLRPIISSIGSVTDTLSKFVDFFLKDIVTLLPSYLRDTTDLLNCLNNCTVNPNTLLVTLDVTSLYTCIPHDIGLAATAKALQTRAETEIPPNIFLCELLNLVLSKNYFTHENKFYIQTLGTAMGTSVAPSYANIVVGDWENEYVLSEKNPFLSNIKFWRRYIDDIICFFEPENDNLTEFVTYINQTTTFLRFTAESSLTSVNFLDVVISKDHVNQIQTTIYRKPMERNTLLHFSSNHPSHLKRNIPTGQFLRLRRNCSSLETFNDQVPVMRNRFLHRGYPSKILEQSVEQALQTPRSELLTKRKKM